jgi:hypothetical protein
MDIDPTKVVINSNDHVVVLRKRTEYGVEYAVVERKKPQRIIKCINT